MELIPLEIDFNSCCRLCLTPNMKSISVFQDNIVEIMSKHLNLSIRADDSLPKNICYSCNSILKQFEILFNLAIENEKKLQKTLQLQKSREEAKQIEDDLADAVNEIGLMLSDGNNLTSNFAANQGDDDSDKSLEIPGSLETDLAKDIDRILAMTQLDDIPPNQMYTCEFCQPAPPFTSLHELNEHLKSAHIDLVFHCETCDNFVDRNSLIQHMLGHLKERENPEETEPPEEENDEAENEVDRDAMSADSARSDKKVVSEPVKLEEDEEMDELVKERKNNMKRESGSNVKFLKKCHYCPKLFSNRSGRLYHQEQFHFNRRRFECDRCEANFGLKQTLMNHIRNKHSNGVRNFQCDLCSKSYKTKSALHNHRIYHSSEPKYSCNYCDKRFHFNFLLRQHETTHLGIKSGATFDCDVCKKTFNTRNKLTKHRGIHDSTQYSCTKDGCNFTGNLKRYLIAHMKRMHS